MLGWGTTYQRRSAPASSQPLELAPRGASAPRLSIQPQDSQLKEPSAAIEINKGSGRKSADGAVAIQSVYAIPLFKEGTTIRYAFIPVGGEKTPSLHGNDPLDPPSARPSHAITGLEIASTSSCPPASSDSMTAQIQDTKLPKPPPTQSSRSILSSVQRCVVIRDHVAQSCI